MMVLLQ